MPLPDSVRTWWIILAALLTTTLGCAKTAPRDATASTAEDTSPVDSALQLLDLDNHPVDFWKQSAGQITVVVFTRAPIARSQIVPLQKFAAFAKNMAPAAFNSL